MCQKRKRENTQRALGSNKFNYLELSEQIALKTGGLNVSTHLDESAFRIEDYEEGVILSSYCLDRNLNAMFDLWEDILLYFNKQLNQYDRLETLIKGQASAYANSVHESGHTFAMMHSASQYGPVDQMAESLHGLTQVNRMQEIARSENFDDITKKLSQIADHILTKNSLRCALNGEANGLKNGMERLETFLDRLPGSSAKTQQIRFEDANAILKNDFKTGRVKLPSKTHFEMPFDVFYAGQCYQSVPYTHEDYPKLLVLAKLMFNKFLLREVREIGGAYGGGANLRGNLFSFFSYRDPHSVETLKRFDQCVDYFVNGKFTDKDVDEAKLATFQQLDKPKSPGSQGMTQFLHGINDDMRQKNRDRIFACGKQHLINVTEKYLHKKPYAATILGPDNPKFAVDGEFRQMTTEKEIELNDTQLRVSSVLNKDNKNYGKKNLIDGSEETCWNSEAGSSQWIQITPTTPFALSSVAIKFQGGFAAKRFAVECRQADGTFTSTAEFYPDDHGKLQISFFRFCFLSIHENFF
ncbi:unnamed protein product [Adineta ricciae]|uniref:Peptidase M16C associated domain-containing protein n=1 Tax=Adineta ricciae TaxID=249248 RepID=A0A814ITW9_ADIRI|nr:unnamed protein product [Adineta ricciae]